MEAFLEEHCLAPRTVVLYLNNLFESSCNLFTIACMLCVCGLWCRLYFLEFQCILNISIWSRVVWGKPNHLVVHMISSNFRCVFSTSKLATKGRQISVLIGNKAKRTNININRTIINWLFRSGWFALYDIFSKANRRCLETEPGGSLYHTWQNTTVRCHWKSFIVNNF